MASNTANTTAADVVGWTAGPGARGTLTLIWSCVITIFACTWTVLHLNVPGRLEGWLMTTLRKMKWMAINVLFPEFIFAKAVCDLRLALEELREFDENIRDPGNHCKWTVKNGDLRHEWVWKVKYPRYWHLLYRLLRLEPPKMVDPEAAVQSQETRSGLQCSQKTKVKSEAQRDVEEQVQSTLGPSKAEASVPDQEEANRAEHDPDFALGRAGQSQTQGNAPSTILRTVQEWTVVHSYYAQMGGLLHPHSWIRSQPPFDEPSYYCLTASMLTPRYHLRVDQPGNHPLDQLILRGKDIQDKSKADWVLKAIAVAQIAWLILSVIVRSIMDFPVAQLEIATISFAVMAILSYTANWWKPKDVSHATILPTFCAGCEVPMDATEPTCCAKSFMFRLFRPTRAAEYGEIEDRLERVPNDLVWMDGETPLLFSLMAISSLVFGGLHCLAWNFKFPTQTELFSWRIASVTSAILPVITLAFNVAISFLTNIYVDSRIISMFLCKLEPLGRTYTDHTEWWQLMKEPHFRDWDPDRLKLLVRTPAGARDWLQELPVSTETIEEQRDSKPEDFKDFPSSRYRRLFSQVQEFREHWEQALSSPDPSRTTTALRRSWLRVACCLKWDVKDETVKFWREYEAFIRDTQGSDISTPDLPNTTCIDLILQVCDEIIEREDSLDSLSTLASSFLTICSGFLYTAARLMNIVLMFTCLRRAPADIYRVTPWVELLPNIS